jgi:hypothetical protein
MDVITPEDADNWDTPEDAKDWETPEDAKNWDEATGSQNRVNFRSDEGNKGAVWVAVGATCGRWGGGSEQTAPGGTFLCCRQEETDPGLPAVKGTGPGANGGSRDEGKRLSSAELLSETNFNNRLLRVPRRVAR